MNQDPAIHKFERHRKSICASLDKLSDLSYANPKAAEVMLEVANYSCEMLGYLLDQRGQLIEAKIRRQCFVPTIHVLDPKGLSTGLKLASKIPEHFPARRRGRPSKQNIVGGSKDDAKSLLEHYVRCFINGVIPNPANPREHLIVGRVVLPKRVIDELEHRTSPTMAGKWATHFMEWLKLKHGQTLEASKTPYALDEVSDDAPLPFGYFWSLGERAIYRKNGTLRRSHGTAGINAIPQLRLIVQNAFKKELTRLSSYS